MARAEGTSYAISQVHEEGEGRSWELVHDRQQKTPKYWVLTLVSISSFPWLFFYWTWFFCFFFCSCHGGCGCGEITRSLEIGMFSLLLACKQYWNLDEVYMLFLLCLYFFFFLSWRLLVWRIFCKPRIWHVSLLVCKHSNLEKTGYFLLRLCFFFFSSWWLLVWRNCRCRFGLNTSLLSCKHWS